MGSLTLVKPEGKMKVISETRWLIVQSNRGGGVRGQRWESICVQSWPFLLEFGKVSDGPKPLVFCSNITSVFRVHTVGAIMSASLHYWKDEKFRYMSH